MSQCLRTAAAIAILAILGVFAVLMLPPYFHNLQFQRELERFAAETDVATDTPDIVRTRVASKAAEMGLPIRAPDIVVERSGSRYRMRALYIVRVDLLFYTVDLHFRPSAGS